MLGADGDWTEYLWIVVTGALAAFYMAWGIGANDVANSFATSVGSRTLKLWQACVIAGIFEFLGAMVLGGETAKTIASEISDVNMYQEYPEMYMYGMLCALAIAGTWILIATYWSMAVSTTHSIIGAIMGFSLVYGGWNGVIWFKEKGTFPYCSGFTPVVLSWFFSPIIGGILSALVFLVNRFCILRRQNSTNLAIWSLPILIWLTLFINLMFVLSKGASSDMKKRWPCYNDIGYHGLSYSNCDTMYKNAVWISAVAALGCAVISGAIGIPLLRRKVAREAQQDEEAHAVAIEISKKEDGTEDGEFKPTASMKKREAGDKRMESFKSDAQRYNDIIIHEVPENAPQYSMPYHYSKKFATSLQKQIVKGLFFDVYDGKEHDADFQARQNSGEVFKPATERIYMVLQVITACCVSFAHGSNDVANAIGPFAAIYQVYQTHQVPSSNSNSPKWIFALGGAGIVIGLMTYGYNIIATLGVELLKLTPSRGYSAELGAGLTISLSSFFGLPVSTTQIIVGAETGVGLCESLTHGVNYRLLLKTFLGWIWTIILALAFCAALFAAGAYAPSILQQNEISAYKNVLYGDATLIYKNMAKINKAVSNTSDWWTLPNATASRGAVLSSRITKNQDTFNKAMVKKGYAQYLTVEQTTAYWAQAQALYVANSNTTIGTVPPPK